MCDSSDAHDSLGRRWRTNRYSGKRLATEVGRRRTRRKRVTYVSTRTRHGARTGLIAKAGPRTGGACRCRFPPFSSGPLAADLPTDYCRALLSCDGYVVPLRSASRVPNKRYSVTRETTARRTEEIREKHHAEHVRHVHVGCGDVVGGGSERHAKPFAPRNRPASDYLFPPPRPAVPSAPRSPVSPPADPTRAA